MKRLIVVGLCALALLAGCKKTQEPAGGKEARPGAGGKAGQPAEAGEGGGVAQRVEKAAGAGCELPAAVDHDFTLKKGCDLRPEETVSISNGATLTIEAGARLRFAPSAFLQVGEGKLVVQGTEKEPVVFTSVSKSPGPGDWTGIVFNDNAASGSVIDHAVLEYAGHDGSWGSAGLTVTGTQNDARISVTNTVIQKCAGVGVHNDTARFARFEGNTLKDLPLAMNVEGDVLGSVGANTFGAPIEVSGEVQHSATWPATDQPFLVTGELKVSGKGEAATLTLPAKAVLKFSDGFGLTVGEEAGGALVARGVTLTSAAKEPNPADWTGITLLEKGNALTLEGCTVAYAGKPNSWGEGVVRLGEKVMANKKASIQNVTFTKCGGPTVIHTPEAKDCAAFAAPALGNKSDGAPLCGKAE